MGTEADYVAPARKPKSWADRHPVVAGIAATAAIGAFLYVCYYALIFAVVVFVSIAQIILAAIS